MELKSAFFQVLSLVLGDPFSSRTWEIVFKFIPFVLFFELPLYVVITLGVLRHGLARMCEVPWRSGYYPSVSCIVTCYSEGEAVKLTIRSLAEQIYPGPIQIVAVVDGTARNAATYAAAREMEEVLATMKNRSLKVLPKPQRGGRVSALNAARNFAEGEIVMAIDGDTSFDNDMVERATRHFEDPRVGAVAGCLRVRNAWTSLATRLQAIEYFLSIQASKTGLSAFNLVNNISGAFGVFRRSVIDLVGGWDSGTAEDLDLTIRIKNYFGRYDRGFRIVFDPEALGFTDVPETFRGFLRQRLRWDGDLSYLYFRKHWRSFTPRLIGWKNFLAMVWTGLFLQIVMPILIIFYTFYLFVSYPPAFVASVLILVYLFYLVMTILLYVPFVLLLSERPGTDLALMPWIVLFPLFAFVGRLNNALATLWELLGRGHEDTSMAPWWVTRKSRF
ncbi:MAG: glycosyltransferase [Synergistales bacterium]|nr:glycosyltransferase [Synergistales bacterium]